MTIVTDLETALFPLFGLGPATSTIYQGTQEESYLPMPPAIGLQNLVLDVDPKLDHEPVPVPSAMVWES